MSGQRKHWYKIWWCHVCMRSERERVYGAKPTDPNDRHATYYCGCMNSHFA